MPVMLDQSDHDRWLDDEQENACGLAVPYSDERMAVIAA
jgi:putative SOS response-associated peptidase YedK